MDEDEVREEIEEMLNNPTIDLSNMVLHKDYRDNRYIYLNFKESASLEFSLPRESIQQLEEYIKVKYKNRRLTFVLAEKDGYPDHFMQIIIAENNFGTVELRLVMEIEFNQRDEIIKMSKWLFERIRK